MRSTKASGIVTHPARTIESRADCSHLNRRIRAPKLARPLNRLLKSRQGQLSASIVRCSASPGPDQAHCGPWAL